MPNKTYALEWIELAKKNLETARILIRENHFTDSIAIEIQQTLEKAFKAVFAYYSKVIPRTHSLPILFNFVKEKIEIEKDIIDDLFVISDYYETDRYPGPRYFVPSREEVESYFYFVEKLLNEICLHLK